MNKQKYLLASSLFAIAALVASPARALKQGALESTNGSCDIINGWACESTTGLAIPVRVFEQLPSGQLVPIGDATINLSYALATAACLGNANAGWQLHIPDLLKDGRPHTVVAKVAYNIQLAGGRTINCSLSPTP